MKRKVLLVIAAMALSALVGCGSGEAKGPEKQATQESKTKDDEKYVAFVTDVGNIDDKSFKTVVGILCGSINLDLITKELNGLMENE